MAGQLGEPAHQLQNSFQSQQFLLRMKLIGFEARHDSSMQAILLHLELLMRLPILIFVVFSGLMTSAIAQHSQPRRDPVQTKTDINSDAKAEETKQAIERARERQKAVDQHNSDLWGRWIYAVCVGCGWTPRNVRIVYTNPSRVLIGIPAADDDARVRAAMRLRS